MISVVPVETGTQALDLTGPPPYPCMAQVAGVTIHGVHWFGIGPA
jgi:hypothetical protein